MSIKRIEPGARMSQAVVHNGTVYLVGQVGEGAKGRRGEGAKGRRGEARNNRLSCRVRNCRSVRLITPLCKGSIAIPLLKPLFAQRVKIISKFLQRLRHTSHLIPGPRAGDLGLS